MHATPKESLVPILHVHKAFSPYMGLQLEHIFKHNFLTIFDIISILCLGFFWTILWSSQSGHHSQNNLAKFGYILDMKVGKTRESFYILGFLLQLTHKSLAIWKKIPAKSCKFEAFFSMRNPLYRLKSHFERNRVVWALFTFHKTRTHVPHPVFFIGK
jgi:hypothetical protein